MNIVFYPIFGLFLGLLVPWLLAQLALLIVG
jgi:hypothetical protein